MKGFNTVKRFDKMAFSVIFEEIHLLMLNKSFTKLYNSTSERLLGCQDVKTPSDNWFNWLAQKIVLQNMKQAFINNYSCIITKYERLYIKDTLTDS